MECWKKPKMASCKASAIPLNYHFSLSWNISLKVTLGAGSIITLNLVVTGSFFRLYVIKSLATTPILGIYPSPYIWILIFPSIFLYFPNILIDSDPVAILTEFYGWILIPCYHVYFTKTVGFDLTESWLALSARNILLLTQKDGINIDRHRIDDIWKEIIFQNGNLDNFKILWICSLDGIGENQDCLEDESSVLDMLNLSCLWNL